MIAIIRTGGKQYLVQPGQKLRIERLPGKAGDAVDFEVLLVSDQEAKKLQVGKPVVSNAKVTGKILKQAKGKKIDVMKFKAKVRYSRKYGHRQPFTEVEITKISS